MSKLSKNKVKTNINIDKVICDKCGLEIPKNQAYICPKCGKKLCKFCSLSHACLEDELHHLHETTPQFIKKKTIKTKENNDNFHFGKHNISCIPHKIIIIEIIVILFIIFLGVSVVITAPQEEIPHIKLDASAYGNKTIIHTFMMGYENVSLSITVPSQLYYGAINSLTITKIEKNKVPEIYRSIINDSMQNEFYSNLLNQFHSIKNQYNLSDDEYLDLLVTYVQSIPYDNNSKTIKYPVVTAINNMGDCDDKSLLLAGLLSKENYNVSLLIYTNINHIGVGIQTNNDSSFSKTNGYAHIETTSGSFIPFVSFIDDVNYQLINPFVISIGNGTKIYSSWLESLMVQDYYIKLNQNLEMIKNKSIDQYNKYYNIYVAFNDLNLFASDRKRLYNLISIEPLPKYV